MASDHFFSLTPDYEIACGETGYFLKMSYGRDGTTLFLRHETREIGQGHDRNSMILCFCSRADRTRTIMERIFQSREMCPKVVLWVVSWSRQRDAEEIYGLGNIRAFLERFFRWYQGGNGVGCYVDDKPKRALVEVRFGTAWYGTYH